MKVTLHQGHGLEALKGMADESVGVGDAGGVGGKMNIQDEFKRDYYNTNREKGGTLTKSKSQARKQQERVLEYFQAHPDRHLSPEDLHHAVMPNAPLTSTRRAITNLTDDGFLEKTTNMVMGQWGKMVHTWRLRKPRQRTIFEMDEK